MSLLFDPSPVEWPPTHYLFHEERGPLPQSAQQAWQNFHPFLPSLSVEHQVTAHLSLYRLDPPLYRAGVGVAEPPRVTPKGLRYELFPGGLYYRWVLTGPYAQLPEACSQAFAQVRREGLQLGEGYFLENYISDPAETPEEALITEILFPAADR